MEVSGNLTMTKSDMCSSRDIIIARVIFTHVLVHEELSSLWIYIFFKTFHLWYCRLNNTSTHTHTHT